MLAPWWLELGLGRLVGRAVLRDLSRGGYVLKKSLGSLSDEWCCVTAMFGLRHRNTGAFGCWMRPGFGINDPSKGLGVCLQ